MQDPQHQISRTLSSRFAPESEMYSIGSPEGQQPRRSRMPVCGYTELSQTDITDLTKILSHASHRSTSGSIYGEAVRTLISDLPSHLRAKIPWISTFCSLHSKMNPLPVISLFNALRQEINGCLPAVWEPLRVRGILSLEQAETLTELEDLSALWLRPDEFKIRYSRSPVYQYQKNKCAACILAHIGGDADTLVALGAYFIGRVSTNIWKRSKRIMWAEAWIRDSVVVHEQQRFVDQMWEVGIELRGLRKNAQGAKDSRAYVDEYVEKARYEQSRGPPRPPRSPSQDWDIDFVENAERNGVPASKVSQWFACASSNNRNEDQGGTSSSSESLRESDSRQVDAVDTAGDSVTLPARADNHAKLRPIASSIYSRNTDDTRDQHGEPNSSSWASPSSTSVTTESVLVDLYRQYELPATAAEALDFDDSISGRGPPPHYPKPKPVNYPCPQLMQSSLREAVTVMVPQGTRH